MSLFTFVLRGLRFYWRTHLSVLAGVALATAILSGALAVGDSVRFTLGRMMKARLGQVTQALFLPEHFFRSALASELEAELKSSVAPAIQVQGSAALPDGSARANQVQVLGVEERFWALGSKQSLGFAVNERLARQLHVKVGDTLILRMEPPALVPRDVPISGETNSTVALRIQVTAIAGDDSFGRFGLRANQVPPYTVFVPLERLQQALKQEGRANLLLTAATQDANPVLRKVWKLADAGLELRKRELRTGRVFLPESVSRVVTSPRVGQAGQGQGALTYFVNELSLRAKVTPYSFVTAFGTDQDDDEITLNTWLAEDLEAKVGDFVKVRYYVIGDRRELVENSAAFRVRAIVPTAKDDSWMPPFPGLADAENCRDWDPGIPIDTDRIRPKDEQYWEQLRGTPKAFISLAAGQKLWANRFGNLTSIRFPQESDISGLLSAKLEPASFGLFFTPVREQALAARRQSMDFGLLFIGFSFFLIVAALLLTAMLFVLNQQQRGQEMGLLKALGFSSGQMKRMVLGEGLLLAAAGSALGVVAGVLYTRLALHGLATVWKEAVAGARFEYHAEPVTLLAGAGSGFLMALLTLWFVQSWQTRRTPVDLLAAKGREVNPQFKGWGRLVGITALLAAAALLPIRNPGAFFGAGACLLIAGLGLSHWWVGWLNQSGSRANKSFHLRSLALRNLARHPSRTLTAVGVLASGIFLLVAVNAFHLEAGADAPGTGGFAFYGESALPIYEDLNSNSGRETLGVSPQTLQETTVVRMRLREGDEASCLNLNRAQQPRLLGVSPFDLQQRNAFQTDWALLNLRDPFQPIPVIGDEQTVVWALGKKKGAELTLIDEHGASFQARIVAVMPGSILQGALLMGEQDFMGKFPSTAGFRVFLVDAPRAQREWVAAELLRGLQERGLELVPASRRLAEFHAVENTYLGIFQALGGLGLLLGSAGLGIVLVRNVIERRGEIALLQALGYEPAALRKFVLIEQGAMVGLGIAIGILSAIVAVIPAGAGMPSAFLLVTVAGVVLSALIWCLVGAWLAMQIPMLSALRHE